MRNLIFILFVGALISTQALAQAPSTAMRSGYSFFGLGLNAIDYEENFAPEIAGQEVDVETSSILNLAQQSGTFVAFNDKWGFYLVSSSTLGEARSDESWDIGDTSIRNNKISIEQQRIAFLLSKHFRSDQYFIFGAQYHNTEFRRFAATLTPAAAQFNVDDSVIDAGTESESLLELTAVVGIEKTNVFASAEPGWRHQFQLLLGVPVLTTISNTNISDGKSFNQSFNGFFGYSRLNYGYQFNKNIFVSLNLDLAISNRNAIDRVVRDSFGETQFPSNTLLHVFPSLALYWSF